MRHDHGTITPAVVRRTARQALQQTLPWKPFGKLVTIARLLGGLLALEKNYQPHEVVAALLAPVDQRGLQLRGVVLDSAFDSGETLLLLPGRGLAYTVPLRKKGKGRNRRNDCFALPLGTVTEVD